MAVDSAAEASEILLNESTSSSSIGELECQQLIVAALDKGNVALALSIHKSMRQARRTSTLSSVSSMDLSFTWPSASIQTTALVVLGLCKQLAIDQALGVLSDIRVQGLPRNDAVGFGKVISSPLAPAQTLTVVQPQEGFKMVADAYSKYEYEVFSGTVVSCKSEALQGSSNLLYAAARAVGIIKKAPPAAVHEFVVQAPDGISRTFRVATETANVPAQLGERITFVCSPMKNSNRKRNLLAPSPPGTRPGEAMTATNHKTGVVTQLLPPPMSSSQSGTIPSWYVPAAVMLAGGDAASSLLDPSLPVLITAGAAFAVGSVVAGNTMLIPKLKQLPDSSLSIEYTRQKLLGQYAQLANKAELAMNEAAEDVRVLARLWQLQNKMESVSGVGAYEARIERVSAARTNIEERLVKKAELLDGYSRVMNMIEIEVEMEIEVPAAELAGIQEQMGRLAELEGLQDDWKAQAEARDEVR